MTTSETVDECATLLLAAESTRSDVDPLTERWPDLSAETAYQIQDEVLRRRLVGGARVIGIKLGLTALKKQQQMNVTSPLTGWLTDEMVLPLGKPLPHQQLIHPRVEPEIVFVMGSRLEGPGVSAADALTAVDAVLCGLEVIDSRYRSFRFTLPDVIADNASAAYFITSSQRLAANSIDLSLETCELAMDGETLAQGTGADVHGGPAEALAFAANSLGRRGNAIEPGWVVLTGGITAAIAAQFGSRIEATFPNLGSIGLDC